MNMSGVNVRAVIAECLVEAEREHSFLNDIADAAIDKYQLSQQDRAFCKRILTGTTELKIRIDYILDLFSAKPVSRQKPYIRAVLRMSVYQIVWMDQIPDHSACDEAVKLVKKKGYSGLSGFVNGTLRNISRSKDTIAWPDDRDPVYKASVMYSCPRWIVELLQAQYGKETAGTVLEDSLKEHPVYIRLRATGDTGVAVLKAWDERGIRYRKAEYPDNAYVIDSPGRIDNLPGYREGSFTVQGLGSMLVAPLAVRDDIRSVIDICAAPGGKCIHAYDILCKPDIKAFDISPERLKTLENNLTRLGIGDGIHTEAMDASVYNPDLEESADLVIADVPCSGLGVMGHKPDIKYNVGPEDIRELAAIQRAIADNAVRYVRPGGVLVYSTCTFTEQENDMQVKYICDRYGFKNITSERIKQVFPGNKGLEEAVTDAGSLQLLAGLFPSDGFYIAVLAKEG